MLGPARELCEGQKGGADPRKQLSGRYRLTQRGRLWEELPVELIRARSPLTPGCLERLWGAFQDRVGRASRRVRGVVSLEAANQRLADHVQCHNRRFAIPSLDLNVA